MLAALVAGAVFGFALLPVLVLQPNLSRATIALPSSLVGILYVVLCVAGVLAVFYPAKCKNMFTAPRNPRPQPTQPRDTLKIVGHHPDCDKFSGNRIKVGQRVFCAACSGLLVGAIFALTGAAAYFFAGLNVGVSSVWVLIIGGTLMLLGVAQIKFAGLVKVVVNMLFVAGSFVVLVETDLLGASFLVDLYALGLIGFMLWLRIYLSEWNNKRTCRLCQQCF